MTTTLVSTVVASPVGPLTVVASDSGLRAVLWADEREGRVRLPHVEPGRHEVLDATAAQLGAYFAEGSVGFDLPLDLVGTEFQVETWTALAGIAPGRTITYAEMAVRLGRRRATRAVGGAIGRNPVSIVLPCHRVIGASGSLTGFAGGIEAKRWLLTHEGVRLEP